MSVKTRSVKSAALARSVANDDVAQSSDPTFVDDPEFGKLSSEGKIIVEFMRRNFEKITKDLSDKIDNRDAVIDKLRQEVVSLKREICEIRDRVDEVESAGRKESVVVSGDGVTAVSSDNCNADGIRELLRSKLRYEVDAADISSVYRIGRKTPTQSADRRNIIVKLSRSSLARDIIKASRVAKPNDLYLNDSLIPSRASILYSLRQLRKKLPHRVDGCGSIDGRVYVWLKPASGSGNNSKFYVNSQRMLINFCEEHLGVSSNELLQLGMRN